MTWPTSPHARKHPARTPTCQDLEVYLTFMSQAGQPPIKMDGRLWDRADFYLRAAAPQGLHPGLTHDAALPAIRAWLRRMHNKELNHETLAIVFDQAASDLWLSVNDVKRLSLAKVARELASSKTHEGRASSGEPQLPLEAHEQEQPHPLQDNLYSPVTPDAQATIDSEDEAILRALKDGKPRLLTQDRIEAASDVSRRTISARMVRLLNLQLVEQPRGSRKGTTITSRGENILNALDAQRVR